MTDATGIARLAEQLVEEARRRDRTLAVAESCTGGEVAAAISAVPGASRCFWGGAVVYTAEAKCALVGLDRDTLAADGAVSGVTTEALAEGIRERSGADLGVAVTGWAGPDAEGPDPVGCVYLAVASPGQRACVRRRFAGDREQIRRQATREVLTIALRAIRAMEANDR